MTNHRLLYSLAATAAFAIPAIAQTAKKVPAANYVEVVRHELLR